eukprot:5630617-Alexandrium_andersonii.AAC.1
MTRSWERPYWAPSWTRSANVPCGGRPPGTSDVRASCTARSRTASSGWDKETSSSWVVGRSPVMSQPAAASSSSASPG